MSFYVRYCYYGVILVHMVTSIAAYHFDMNNVILYEDPAKFGSRGSYFGYSVALWNPGNRNLSDSWMFVGAPRANSSIFRGVNEPGTVFKCKISEQCREWVMNNEASEKPTEGSWLGGAMNIENKSNPEVLVCGPKWINYEEYRKLNFGKFIPGICYWAKAGHDSSIDPNTFRPTNPLLRTIPFFGQNDLAVQQAGFSIHMVPSASPSEFVLGCPNPVYRHGVAIRFNPFERNFIIPWSSNSIKDKFDYSGYAVTSGKYFNPRERVYAIGAPRGASLRGSVDLFDFPMETKKRMKIHLTKTGEQLGEYFGAALASCDIDGDKKDELLVGAPQWTKTLGEGRVYIFNGTNDNSIKQFKSLTPVSGIQPRGRFGSTITCLGDVDYDGYADVAVGAPFDGNGVVYIFHGGKNGLTRSPQRIAGPEATKGFGTSISEPRDVDNNGYADIAVGAYLSGHVTLIRSKRVVSMAVVMYTHLSGKLLNREANFFSVSVCSSYGGAYAPRELNVTRELKIDEIYGRAKVEMEGKLWTVYNHSETLRSDVPESCQNFTIKINKVGNFDYFTPLHLSVSQNVDPNEKNGTLMVKSNNVSGDDNFHTSDAVTKKPDLGSAEYPLDVPFEVDCDNNMCRSNLSIEMTTDLEKDTRYVIGSEPNLKLDVKVNNSGDHAYLAKAYVDIPIFIGVLRKPPMCNKYSEDTTHVKIMCNIGNPLAKNQMKTFSMILDMSAVPINTPNIKFTALATTVSGDIASGNHKADLYIDCIIKADIGIAGQTDVDWYSSQKEQKWSNIMIQHTFEIRNNGVTPVSRALLSISFPTHWIHADNEIEIVKLNETLGNLDGEKFICQCLGKASNISSLSYDATTMPEWLLSKNSSKLASQLEKKFIVVNGTIFSASSDIRTLYINTSNPSVKWKTIDCLIGPFATARSAAEVVLTFDLLLSNLTPEIMQDKDIIFFATNGSTKITVPNDFTQTVNNEPDVVMIGTIFIGSKPERQIATWVVAVSVLVGLFLLILIVFVLFKFGFFERSKKAELKALEKLSENTAPRVSLHTGSSLEN